MMTPQYNTKLFCNIWDNVGAFVDDVTRNPLSVLDVDKYETIFYLLYAQYGNSPIANFDEEQFKFKVYSIIYKYGPSWAKRVDIQKKLREMLPLLFCKDNYKRAKKAKLVSVFFTTSDNYLRDLSQR